MIRFSVSRAEKEPVFLEGSEPAAFWDLPADDQFTPVSQVTYELKVASAAGSFLVTGSVRGRVAARCGRCLAPLELEICNGKVELYYAKADIDSEELDITADVRDELLVELPMNPLCREDCKGLCPVCGADRNRKKCRCKVQGSLAWSALDDIVIPEEK